MLYNNMCIVAACFIADLYLGDKASFEAQTMICNANLTEQVQGSPPPPMASVLYRPVKCKWYRLDESYLTYYCVHNIAL